MATPRDLHKLAYLDALGLQLLVARKVLPGAAPSAPRVRFERRIEPSDGAAQSGSVEPLAAAAPTPAARAPSAPSPQANRAQQAELPPAQPAIATSSPISLGASPPAPVATSPPAPVAAPAVSFSAVAVVSGGCLWLQAAPAPELPAEQLQLIRAMAFARGALAGPGAQRAAQVTRFDWPLHRNRQLDLSAEAAAAALTGFVLRQLRDQGCGGLVLLGESAGHYLLQPELADVPTVRLPDTAEMIADPARKREAWIALMALER